MKKNFGQSGTLLDSSVPPLPTDQKKGCGAGGTVRGHPLALCSAPFRSAPRPSNSHNEH